MKARAKTKVPAWAATFFEEPKRASAPIQARYDAAGSGRRMRGWTPPTSGPNRATQGLQKIRDRSRDATRNDWTGAGGIQHWKTNLVGTGIRPHFNAIAAATKKVLVQRAWAAWCKDSDADGVLDFYGQQALAVGAWLEAGEVFARLRYRRASFGMDVPLQVQLVEADFVPIFDADVWPGMSPNNRIRQGIELTNSGQRVAYWVYREHPQDFASQTVSMSQLVRVPVEEMLHIFEPKRPGQLRGVPEFAPVLARLRNVADFDDAVLERQKLGNLFMAFIKKNPPNGFDGIDPMTGQQIETADDGAPLVAMMPGTVQELLPGEEVQFANPPEAGTIYPDYMRQQNMGTAAGQGLPYEILSGDIKEVSDRTLRIIINEFRRFCEQRQWHVIIPMFCQKVLDAWADQAAVAGVIAAADVADVKDVEWSPQGWPYIHPVQDAQGKRIEVDAGFRSRSSVIAERGDDPEKVDEERAADQKRAEDLGLNPNDVAPEQITQNDTTTGGNQNDTQPAAPVKNEMTEAITALMSALPVLLTALAKPQGQTADPVELALRERAIALLEKPRENE